MRGVYTAAYQITGVTTSKTLMYLTAPSTAVVEILSAKVTDANVTTAEQLDIGIAKIATLGTPTATTLTPKPIEAGSSSAGSTVKGNVTASEPTYEVDGSSIALFIDHQGASNMAGYYYDPLPEERPIVSPSASIGIKLLAVPSNSYTLNVVLTFREIGG